MQTIKTRKKNNRLNLRIHKQNGIKANFILSYHLDFKQLGIKPTVSVRIIIIFYNVLYHQKTVKIGNVSIYFIPIVLLERRMNV